MTHQIAIGESIAARLRNCKVIMRMGVGLDIIDVLGCRKYGIEVCYVPDYGTEDVANHAIALLFAVHPPLITISSKCRRGPVGF
jgi:lactate dehydrogenase-like 2-hydroxyacid dehydrogenase